MVKKCVYCKCDISNNCDLDVCDRCGHGVWGAKMFNAIKSQMANARERGDLEFNSTKNC